MTSALQLTDLSHATDLQALAVSLLSNCLLAPAVRDASSKLLNRNPDLLEPFIKYLQVQKGQPTKAGVQLRDKVYGLFSNLSMHPGARDQLAQCTTLLELSIAATMPGTSEACAGDREGSTAAMGLLCNLSIAATVQQRLAGTPGCVGSLLDQTCSASGSHMMNSKQSDVKAVRANPQLPPRKQPRHQSDQHSLQQQLSTVDKQLQRQRAACLLSRAAKQPAGIQALVKLSAVGRLVTALQDRPQQGEQGQPPQEMDNITPDEQHAAGSSRKDLLSNEATWCDAVIRTIALLTARSRFCSDCSAEEAAAVIKVCMDLLGTVQEEAVLGNAALCLGHFAAESSWHQQLHKADAVKVLVDIAYKGKGSPSSKNAAIALAKLAKDERMLERLRDLHGLEIIYQYVRV